MIRRILFRVLLGLWLAVTLAVAADAAETIRSFDTLVELQPDSSVRVTEAISVNAEGNEIRHGIFRDVPLGSINPSGVLARSTLTIDSVELDGADVPYSTETLDNDFRRIRIGDADTLVSNGPHRYTLRYTMTRMARQFADHDELFWNATGNYWTFPIQSATATIVLPAGATITNLVGYTGAVGSQESAVTIVSRSDTRAVLRTTRVLGPGEGLSVAAAFPKGVLTSPTGAAAWTDWLSDYRGYTLPLIGLLIVFGVDWTMWSRVGRDPRRGTIIPLFHPPADLSPGQAHYVANYGFRKNGWTAMIASIFDLGVRGLVSIDNSAKVLKIASSATPAATALPAGEDELNAYFRASGTVTIDKANGRDLEKQRARFVAAIRKQSGNRFFNRNAGWALLGLLVTVAVLVALTVFDVVPFFWTVVAIVLGLGALVVSSTGRLPSLRLRAVLPILWIAVIGSNAVLAAAGSANGIHFDAPNVGAVSIILVNTVFMALMRAPTVAGRKVMDELDGFRMYLDTAERERLNMHGEPPMTVSRFEAILPFAIALGVEKPWSNHFEAELARNGVADAPVGSTYRPIWFAGPGFSSDRISNSVSTMASTMSAAMIAAQPVSSSSSGFGGGSGGGSGGGGGGGGGGGW